MDKKFKLLKDIVIPAGAVFVENKPDIYSKTIGLTKDTWGELFYYNDTSVNKDELSDWFEEIK